MPEPEPVPGLVLEGVSAGYGARQVLREVSVRASPGEITGLIGANGSGKTTVIRVASRGLRPERGVVRVAGWDPYDLSARRAARLVAVVPQDVLATFPFSVLETVLMGRAPYLSPWGAGRPEDWSRVRSAMSMVGVSHLGDRAVSELSGGERQRVILAQALAQDAPVLLLDEPTTHLDIRHVVRILTLVRGLARREGTAVLAIFHDLNLASVYCDRIYALKEGRVVARGAPASVISSATLQQVFGVRADVLPGAAAGRPAVVFASAPQEGSLEPGAMRVHVIGGAGRGAELIRALMERGLEVSTGVLHATDTDAAVAERLNLIRITVPPFSQIDAGSAAECIGIIRKASALIVCDAPFGPGNVENLRIAIHSAREGVPTILLQQVPIEERDFTGGEATDAWRRLASGSAVTPGVEATLDAVEAIRSRGARRSG
ncbi:ABC transporter ATP-binding protein [soil metagenome]